MAPTFAVVLNPSVVAGDTVELLLAGSPLAQSGNTRHYGVPDVTVGLTVVSGDLGADGPKQVTAQFRDTAGNGSMGLAQNFTLDVRVPWWPSQAPVAWPTQTRTRYRHRVDLAEAGATVTIFNGANPIGSAIVRLDGTWSSSVILNNGNNELTARVADAAGNLGVSDRVIYTIDDAPVATRDAGGGHRGHGLFLTAAIPAGRVSRRRRPGAVDRGGQRGERAGATASTTATAAGPIHPSSNLSGPVSFNYTASTVR